MTQKIASCSIDEYHILRRQRLESLLDSSEREEHFFFGTKLIICFKLPSGVIIPGTSRPEMDCEDFSMEAAKRQCYEDAICQLSQFEEYRIYWQNYQYLRSKYRRDA